MQRRSVSLIPLEPNDREQFILDNQRAFWYGAMQEFGMRDDHLDSQGEIISRKTIAVWMRRTAKPTALSATGRRWAA